MKLWHSVASARASQDNISSRRYNTGAGMHAGSRRWHSSWSTGTDQRYSRIKGRWAKRASRRKLTTDNMEIGTIKGENNKKKEKAIWLTWGFLLRAVWFFSISQLCWLLTRKSPLYVCFWSQPLVLYMFYWFIPKISSRGGACTNQQTEKEKGREKGLATETWRGGEEPRVRKAATSQAVIGQARGRRADSFLSRHMGRWTRSLPSPFIHPNKTLVPNLNRTLQTITTLN